MMFPFLFEFEDRRTGCTENEADDTEEFII